MMTSLMLKYAQVMFEQACRLRTTQRLELYIDGDRIWTSDVLEEDDPSEGFVLYGIWGHGYLEGEILAWIDQARVNSDPTPLDRSIIDLTQSLAQGRLLEEVVSAEVFANLPLDRLEQIEHAIIEYWWSNGESHNGKSEAKESIEKGLIAYQDACDGVCEYYDA